MDFIILIFNKQKSLYYFTYRFDQGVVKYEAKNEDEDTNHSKEINKHVLD